MVAAFEQLLARPEPLLALAPMQDVTDLPFWRLMAHYGGPDVYWTEYFRVHAVTVSAAKAAIFDLAQADHPDQEATAHVP